LSEDTDEVISIQYHTNFPGNDPLNADNPADPSARALFYGVPQTPRTAIDGYIINQKFSAWGSPVLSRKKLTETAFAIEMDFPQSPDEVLNIKASIKALLNISDTLTLHLAVIEKQVADLYTGAPVFHNVLKKLLPNAAGTRFTRVWQPGDSQTIEQSWQAVNVKDPSQLAVVAFIQNQRTKEIYQAVIRQPSTPPAVITSQENTLSEAGNFNVYPNPASSQAHIVFGQPVSQEYTWTVYDILGRKTAQGTLSKGEKELVLNTSTYTEGTYMIYISGRNKASYYKKLVILHSK
jgi:hypothetical protein